LTTERVDHHHAAPNDLELDQALNSGASPLSGTQPQNIFRQAEMKRKITKAEAEARGFAVDTTVYPWVAYAVPALQAHEVVYHPYRSRSRIT